jgi:uncharacterized integral membrane protein
MFRWLRTLALVAITVLVTIFSVQNLASTEVVFLTWSIHAPRALIYFLLFALGLATGFLIRALRPKRQTAVAKPAAPPKPPASA